MVASNRSGRTRLGCLVFLLIVAALGYFGVDLAQPYMRYYRFRDAMAQEARFADHLSDAKIVIHLRAQADSLGLPPEAQALSVRRTTAGIEISSSWTETVVFPRYTREIPFRAYVQRIF
ncbi:MAG: hypothetical protein M3068_11250 [Gemmatimonadota bacterium]|nr:hypothetical protein [Gemmatimonadota bacterium]